MNQIKAGAILSYVSLFLTTFLGIVYTPFMLREMGQSEFGLYSLAASVIAYLTLFDFGFGNAVARFTAKFKAEGKRRELYEMLGMFFLIYCVIALLVAVFGYGLYCSTDLIFGAKMTTDELIRAKVIILILACNLVFTFPLFMFGSVVTAYEDFIFQRGIHIVRILLQTGIMIPLLIWGYKAVALAVLLTVMNIGTLLVTTIYCFKKIKIRLLFTNIDWRLLKEISGYSFFIFLGVAAERICWSSGQFILGYTSGTSAVATYAVAIRIIGFYTAISTAIPGVLLPKITTMVARDSSMEELSALFIRTGRIQFYIIGTVFVGFVLFGRQFVNLWAGEVYSEAYWVTLLIMGALIPTLIQNTGVVVLQAMGRLHFRSSLHIFVALVGIAVGFIGARFWGGVGCALGIAMVFVLGNGVILNYYYSKFIKLDILKYWRSIFEIVIPLTLVSALFGYIKECFLQEGVFYFVVGGVIFSVAVGICYWVFSMNTYEKGLLLSAFTRMKNMLL